MAMKSAARKRKAAAAAAVGATAVSDTVVVRDAAVADTAVAPASAVGAVAVAPASAVGDSAVAPDSAVDAIAVAPDSAVDDSAVAPASAVGAVAVAPASAVGDSAVAPDSAVDAIAVAPAAAADDSAVAPASAVGAIAVPPAVAVGDTAVAPDSAVDAITVAPAAAADDSAVAPASAVGAIVVPPAIAVGDTAVAPAAPVGKRVKKRKARVVVVENNPSAKKPKQDVADAVAALQKEIEEKKAELERLLEQAKSDSSASDELKADDQPKKPVTTIGSTPAADKDVVAERADGEDDSDGGSSDYRSDEEELSNTLEKDGTNVKMSDADKDLPKTPTAPKAAGSKVLFAGNLSFQADEVDVHDFFGKVVEIEDVRLGKDSNGTFKGYAHVEFASEADALKAFEFNGKELMGRPVKLDFATDKREITYNAGSMEEAQIVFVKGFNKSLGEDELRDMLEEHFGKCGVIERLSIPHDSETGVNKGIAFVQYMDSEMTQKALALDKSEIGDFQLTVNVAKPRVAGGVPGGRGRGGRGGRGRGGRGGKGRGDRGRLTN